MKILTSIFIFFVITQQASAILCGHRKPLPIKEYDFPKKLWLYAINDISTAPKNERPNENVCHIYDFPDLICHALRIDCEWDGRSAKCQTYAVSRLYERMVQFDEILSVVPEDEDGHKNEYHVYETKIILRSIATVFDSKPVQARTGITNFVENYYNSNQFALTDFGPGWKLFEFCKSDAKFILLDADANFEPKVLQKVKNRIKKLEGEWRTLDLKFDNMYKFKP